MSEAIELRLAIKSVKNTPLVEEVGPEGAKTQVFSIVTSLGFEGRAVDTRLYERLAQLKFSGEIVKLTIEPEQGELPL